MSRSYFIFILLLITLPAFSEFEDEPRIITFFKNYYSKPEHVENQNFINLNYGLSFYDDVSNSKFSNHYQIEGYYGFYRLDDRTKMTNVSRFASDYTFLGNISTDFKSFDTPASGIESDNWRFGFGISDGFVYNLGKNSNFYLIHSSDWVWSRIDVIQKEIIIPERLNIYDETFRFGNKFSGSMRLQLYEGINLDLEYEHTLVYPAHVVPQWLGMWLFDNITQRWFDYFEPEWVNIFGRQYPWIRFIYKNALSYIIYEFRQDDMYYPFQSANPLSMKTYRIGITYVF